MKLRLPQLILFMLTLICSGAFAQNSKKGFEYSGTKTRYSMLGKSRMFSEGIKTTQYTVYWNKKKNTVQVNAGPKEKWYTIQIVQVDTIHGNVTHVGYLEDVAKSSDMEAKAKGRCEVRFLMDKITIKIGEARLEEFLLDGALIWDDNKVSSSN